MAKNLFKLMAYKDEYEVARLFTDGEFKQRLAAAFEGDLKLKFHMAPPLFARRDERTGELKKATFGGWYFMPAMKLIASLRFLRGTAFDVFGKTAERREERKLIGDYEELCRELIARLDADNHALAVSLASLPEKIRGFGHVKAASLAKAREEWAKGLEAWRNPPARRQAAD